MTLIKFMFNNYQDMARRAALSAQIVQEKKVYLTDCVSQGVEICPVNFVKRRKNVGVDYEATAIECEQICADNDERLATLEEGLWFAKNAASTCATMWFYYDNKADTAARSYPMFGAGSSGCGGAMTGDAMAPRLISSGVYYNMAEYYAERSSLEIQAATMNSNCACISYPDF